MNEQKREDRHFVLIRGLARQSGHWGDFPESLLLHFSSDTATASLDLIDLPGTGRRADLRSPLTVPAITRFLREKHQPPKSRKSTLIALSLGGMIAANWLQAFPEDFDSCVLINTSFRGFSPINQRITTEAIRSLLRAITSSDLTAREEIVLNLVSNRLERRRELKEIWTDLARKAPQTRANFLRQLIAASRFRASRAKPQARVLVLASTGDRMVSSRCSEAIARIWQAKLSKHPTAGHDLAADGPAWVIDEIASWLAHEPPAGI